MYKERKKIAKKTFGNFPFLSVIFSVSLSLLLLGIFSFFLLTSFQVKKVIQENTEVNIYLNKGISNAQVDQIKRILFTKEYSLSNDENTLSYVSSKQAAEDFSKEINTISRQWNKTSNRDEFSKLVYEMAIKHIPTSYLENYKDLVDLIPVRWPKNPKIIFTSVSWFLDEVFKSWSAETNLTVLVFDLITTEWVVAIFSL